METEKLPITEELTSKLDKTCVTSMLKTNQIQNGLKHSEFSVYRRYCAKKIKNLRKKIGLKYSGKKKKEVTKKMGMGQPSTIDYYWISLYNAEKYWAYAMEMKQGLRNPEKKDFIRHNIVNKLKRAVQWCTHFKSAVAEANCKRTTLEAESQLLFFTGLLKVEERKFRPALEDFLKSRAILTQILELVGSIEKVHLQEKVEQIDNNIRFCRYQLNEYAGNAEELAELQKMLMADHTLSVKLEDLADGVKDEGTGGDSVKKVCFGKTIEIQDPKLIHILKELEILEKTIKKERGSSMDNELEKKDEALMENFTQIFNKYDDAIRFCDQNAKKEGISEALQKLWKGIASYFQASKCQKFLERSWILLHQLLTKFVNQKGFDNIFSTKVDYKNVKPQDVVKLCDLALQILSQIRDIAMDMDSRCDREDLIDRYYSYIRGYFVSLFHISQSNYQYGISLLCQMQKRSETLVKDLEGKKKDDSSFQDMINDVKLLETEGHIAKVKAHMTLLEEEQQQYEDLPNILDDMDIQEGKKVEKTDSLFDILYNNDDNVKKSKQLRPFANFPPDAKLIPTKPIMLDICYSKLVYPSMDHRVEKKAEEPKSSGGFMSKIGGFFGGGKK